MNLNKLLPLLTILVTLNLVGCNETENPTLTRQSLLGNWNLSSWDRTDNNPNPDGQIFGVYCNDVHFHSNDSVKFFFGHNLSVGKGTWDIIEKQNRISIHLEGREPFNWSIITFEDSELTFDEQSLSPITEELITITYKLEKE